MQKLFDLKTIILGLLIMVIFSCSTTPTSSSGGAPNSSVSSSTSSEGSTSSVSSSTSSEGSTSSVSSSTSTGSTSSVSSSTSTGSTTNELFAIFSDTVPNTHGLTFSTNYGVSDYWLNAWAAPGSTTVYELITGASPSGDGNRYLRLYIREGSYGGGITFALSNTTLGYDMSRFTNGYLVFSISVPAGNGDPIIALERQEWIGPNHRASQIVLSNGAYGFQKDGTMRTVVIPIAHFIQATSDEGLHGRMQASDFTNLGTFFQLRGQNTGGGNLSNVILDNIYWYR